MAQLSLAGRIEYLELKPLAPSEFGDAGASVVDGLCLRELEAGLGVSGNTVRSYLDVLADFYMVRQLAPWSGNSRKRRVRSPEVYVGDAGLLCRLVNVPDLDTLLTEAIGLVAFLPWVRSEL